VTRPLTGAYYFVPSAEALAELAEQAPGGAMAVVGSAPA
jgi:hypothetical protein